MVSRHNTAIRIYETKMQTPAAKVLISAFLGQTVLPSRKKDCRKKSQLRNIPTTAGPLPIVS